MSDHSNKSISEIIQGLFETVRELELRYPGRKFSIDGHLLGSLGEVIAAKHYGLTLLKNSFEKHDAIDKQNRMVQIKATQINRIALSSEPLLLCAVWRIFCFGIFIDFFKMGVDFCFSCGY